MISHFCYYSHSYHYCYLLSLSSTVKKTLPSLLSSVVTSAMIFIARSLASCMVFVTAITSCMLKFVAVLASSADAAPSALEQVVSVGGMLGTRVALES